MVNSEIVMRDTELRDAVERALDYEPSIDAADIGVAAENGVVTLTGHVATYAQKFAAERVVQGVNGVRGIAQEIEVRDGAARQPADDEIAARALNCIAWDVTVPDNKVQVKVQKGRVTLTGKVDWYYQRMAAEHAVRKLAGVLGVSNQIAVQPLVKPGDIKQRIESALKRSAEVEARGITVKVDEAKVILEGTARTWLERNAIERAAWSAPGVQSVDDRISVV
ncbi:BON domain protein [Bordetella bronchiseptica 00-P-2730]|nr:BON domain protein [Bordetella bronchiseptica 00-P-2730]